MDERTAPCTTEDLLDEVRLRIFAGERWRLRDEEAVALAIVLAPDGGISEMLYQAQERAWGVDHNLTERVHGKLRRLLKVGHLWPWDIKATHEQRIEVLRKYLDDWIGELGDPSKVIARLPSMSIGRHSDEDWRQAAIEVWIAEATYRGFEVVTGGDLDGYSRPRVTVTVGGMTMRYHLNYAKYSLAWVRAHPV